MMQCFEFRKLLYTVVSLCGVFLVVSVCCAEEAVDKKPISPHIGTGMKMEKRIRKILANPKVLEELDQRRSFKSDADYERVLNQGLLQARVVLPQLFSESFKSNALVSVNMHEEKIFFRLTAEDKEIVGWIPLFKAVPADSLEGREFVLCLIPNLTVDTSLTKVWRERQLQKADFDAWVERVVKMTLGVDVRISTVQEIETDVESRRYEIVGRNTDSAVDIDVSEEVLQMSVSLAQVRQSLGPGKPTVDAPLNLAEPMTHVTWPTND